MTNFEERLLNELKTELATMNDTAAAPRARLFTRRRLAWAVSAATGLLAAAISAPMLLGPPAYAVAEKPDGTIKVKVNDASAHKSVEKELREMGARVIVDYVPDGQSCQEDRGTQVHPPGWEDPPRTADGPPPVNSMSMGGDTWTIDPGTIKKGQTMVVELHGSTTEGTATMSMVDGPVKPCDPS